MAALPPEALAAALSAVHGAGAKGSAPATAGAPGAGGGADPSQDPNAQAAGDPNAQGGTDPQTQAVWDAFPSTDPGQIPQGGGDPQAFAGWLGSYMQQAQADHDQMTQQQEAVLSQAIQANGGGAPTTPGQDTSGAAPQSPGVGGVGAGY